MMVFFSKNQKTALRKLKSMASSEKRYKGKTVRLSKTQIPHMSGWKTWKIIDKE